jgi:hypothetical protein
MWGLIKFFIVIGVFVYNLLGRPRFVQNNHVIDGVSLSSRYKKPRKRSDTDAGKTIISIPFRSRCVFRLYREGSTDRFFKRWGLSREFQTADPSFDELIYVVSDHLGLANLLRYQQPLRETLTQYFSRNCISIVSDGSTLTLSFEGDVAEEKVYLQWCVAIRKAFEPLVRVKGADPFAFKVVFLESLLFALGVWGGLELVSGVELFDHVSSHSPILRSLLFGGAVGAIIFVGIFLIFSRSSRGSRILLELGLIMCVVFPALGLIATNQINVKRDSGRVYQIKAVVNRAYTTTSKRRMSYWIRIEPVSSMGLSQLSRDIRLEIPDVLYSQLHVGDVVELSVRQGGLNYPWYESVQKSSP